MFPICFVILTSVPLRPIRLHLKMPRIQLHWTISPLRHQSWMMIGSWTSSSRLSWTWHSMTSTPSDCGTIVQGTRRTAISSRRFALAGSLPTGSTRFQCGAWTVPLPIQPRFYQMTSRRPWPCIRTWQSGCFWPISSHSLAPLPSLSWASSPSVAAGVAARLASCLRYVSVPCGPRIGGLVANMVIDRIWVYCCCLDYFNGAVRRPRRHFQHRFESLQH